MIAERALRDRDATRAESLLTIRNLRVSYGRAVKALHDVSIDVPDRSVVAVLGNNGAGKSTLLRAISGTLPMHGGRIVAGTIGFAGKRLSGLDPSSIVRAGVVKIPEGRRIFGTLTVEENLRVAALATERSTRAAARERVYDLFPALRERRSQRGSLLSGGEQQMLAIGRALMAAPKLLLLDEPSLGLAPNLVRHVAEVIKEINNEGTPVLIVEQDAAMALELADHAYVLEVGQVALEGPARELAESPEIHDSYLGGKAKPRAVRGVPPVQVQEPTATHALRIDNLSVRFGGVKALSGVSFLVEPGTTHAVIGPNGAGKSTLINVLTGVYTTNEGTVFFGSNELTRMRPPEIGNAGVSRTFQNIAISPTASVADNLMLGRYRLTRSGFLSTGLRIPRAVKEQHAHLARVREIAELVGLEELLDVEAGSLPYGHQKRVELGRALSAEPGLLLLDEPVAGMNAGESVDMAAILRHVQERLGISVVVVEHNMPFVMNLADRITVLDFGRCIADGTPGEVQRDPAVIRAYLGGSEDRSIRNALETEDTA